MQNKITHVIKRSSAIVPFKEERVINAIYGAAVAVGGRDKEKAEELANRLFGYSMKSLMKKLIRILRIYRMLLKKF